MSRLATPEKVCAAIVDRARRLCCAGIAAVSCYDGELLHLVSAHADLETATLQAVSSELERVYPMTLEHSGLNPRAVRERRTVQSADLLAEPEYDGTLRDAVLLLGARGAVVVPIIHGDAVLGTIMVLRSTVGHFPGEQVAILETFAAQAAIALDNARLFNETQAALERQSAAAEVLRVISESVADTAPVFEQILDSCARLFKADEIAIPLLHEDGLLYLTAYRGPMFERMRKMWPMRYEANPARTAVASGRAMHYPNVTAENADTPGLRDAHRILGDHSVVIAPLVYQGCGIGSIDLARHPPRAFGEDEIRLLTTFADQAVIAIHNQRLFTDLRESLERQTATAEILKVIGRSPTDVQPVFDAIAGHAMKLCGADMGIATRYDGAQLHLTSLVGAAPEAETMMRSLFPMMPGRGALTARAVLEGVPVQTSDALTDPDYAGTPVAHSGGFLRSRLAVPLLHDGRCIGAIGVAREAAGSFSPALVALLETFADQAVIAIENARLFRETHEALERQTATAEILKVISESPTDVQPVFDAITARAMKLCGAQIGTTTRCDGESISLVALAGLAPAAEAAVRGAFPVKPGRKMLAARAVLERATVQIPDVLEDPDYAIGGMLGNAGIRSGLSVPMLREGVCIGAITVGRAKPGLFPDKLVTLLETFAAQAVIAIENVRLFNDTREALSHQTATAEVLRVISSSVADTAPVFEKILESCLRLFTTDQAGVFLVRDGMVHLEAVRGVGYEKIRALWPRPLHAQDTQALRVARHVVSAKALPDPSPVIREALALIDDWSSISAPMLWEDRLVGSIIVTRQPPRPFTDKEHAQLVTFADQAVIAIENARLFHEIEAKSHELAVANQHKSEFLANMSHELRTPLNAIIGFSEVMLDRMFGELNDKQDEYLKDIHASGKHLLSLINDILDLSKIEAGRMELELEAFDVAAALDNTLTLVRERAQRHGIGLALEVAPRIGTLRADQRKLKQIMLNLLSNAVKFTPDGGRIAVRAWRADGVLSIAVSDTGIGIAPADQELVFQEFRQVGGTYANKQEGSGLGLALVRRFVELHGGTIGVTSTPGQGSTFTFTLPEQP